jgi:hypothetical protein
VEPGAVGDGDMQPHGVSELSHKGSGAQQGHDGVLVAAAVSTAHRVTTTHKVFGMHGAQNCLAAYEVKRGGGGGGGGC